MTDRQYRFNEVRDPRCCGALPTGIRLTMSALCLCLLAGDLLAASPFAEPVVARVEMKLAVDENVVDVIEKGDLLTVIEERVDDYVIVTHDGNQGAVAKVNAVRIAESGEIYTDLIELNPTEGRFYTLRASSWWALGKTEKALDDFDRAIDLGYNAAHAYTSRGLFHAEMGNVEEAIADYSEALKVDPDDLSPAINRAAVYMSIGEFDKAIEDYTRVLKERSNANSILHQRAIALKAAGRLDEAAEDFERILRGNPDDYAAIMGHGYVRFQQQDYENAVVDFSRAIELNNEDPVAWNNRGYNRHQIDEFADALEDYNQAIRLAPNYALALQNRAWLLATAADQDVRDPETAVVSAKQACQLSNFESVADLSVLAAALAANGQFDEAVGWQEKVVESVAEQFKEFAKKTLERYQNGRPFAADPDQANAEEQAQVEREAEAKAQARKAAQEAAQQAAQEAQQADSDAAEDDVAGDRAAADDQSKA